MGKFRKPSENWMVMTEFCPTLERVESYQKRHFSMF
jgi:hypothetical protein